MTNLNSKVRILHYDNYIKKILYMYKFLIFFCLGQVIWVVGAGRGLGASISVSAAARGARLVLTSRTKNDLEKVKTECLDAGRYKEMKSEDVLVLPFDVSNTLEHEKHVKKVIDQMGKISGNRMSSKKSVSINQ